MLCPSCGELNPDRCRRATGDPADEERLRQAREAFRRIGAAPTVRDIDALLDGAAAAMS